MRRLHLPNHQLTFVSHSSWRLSYESPTEGLQAYRAVGGFNVSNLIEIKQIIKDIDKNYFLICSFQIGADLNKCPQKSYSQRLSEFGIFSFLFIFRGVWPPTGLFYRRRPPQLHATHRKSGQRRKRHHTKYTVLRPC